MTEGLAAGEGFEPSQTESESGVLPLHKSPSNKNYYTTKNVNVNTYFSKLENFFEVPFWGQKPMKIGEAAASPLCVYLSR